MNIRLDQEQTSATVEALRGIDLIRGVVSTNILAVTENESGVPCLLLFNAFPTKWNRWMPLFYTTSIDYKFVSKAPQQIVDEFISSALKKAPNREQRASAALDKFIQTTGLSAKSLGIVRLFEEEFWVRFSQTENVWSVYLLEMFAISANLSTLKRTEAWKFGSIDYTLLPIAAMVETHHRRVEVVDNIRELLNDAARRAYLVKFVKKLND